MKLSKKKLYIFTDGFPYGKGEKTFIIPELNELIKKYKVTIISVANKIVFLNKNDITKLNNEIDNKVIKIKLSPFDILIYGFKALFDSNFRDEIINILKLKKYIFGRIKRTFGFYIRAKYTLAKCNYYNIFKDIDNSIYYTFWNNTTTLALCLKKEYDKNLKIISRIHGYDLYNEREKYGLQPFKKYIDSRINLLVFACKYAKKYYIQTFLSDNKYANKKYIVRYIGTNNNYKLPHKSINHIFTIVSCSNVIELKRINLIVDVLSMIPDRFKIKWVHFGDGDIMNTIINYTKKKFYNKNNISYKFYGFYKHDKLMKWYSENSVDCFITLSSTEGGVPISIIEAMSFGIPIIATKVGGIPEAINGNGILVENSNKNTKILNYIKLIFNNRKNIVKKYRNNSLNIFNKHFNNELYNYDFLNQLT